MDRVFTIEHPPTCSSGDLRPTRHVFVKHGCPRRQQSRNMAKISKSYILTPPHPQGHVMSVKCEQPIDELTVQVWLLYHNPNFKYCTLFVSGTGRDGITDGITDGQTDKQTDGRTDDPNTRCPRRTFQAGGIKNKICVFPATCLKTLGSVGPNFFFFYGKEVMDKLFFQLILLLLHPNNKNNTYK